MKYFLLPTKDENNVCEEILGCPLSEYTKYWFVLSETEYKQRHSPHMQKAFVQYLYDQYGKEELIKLIDVIDALQYKSLLRLFAFGILVKQGIYKPSKGDKHAQITPDQFKKHSRRLSVIIALRKDYHLSWEKVSEIIKKKITGTYNVPYLHKDNVWLPMKKRIDEWKGAQK